MTKNTPDNGLSTNTLHQIILVGIGVIAIVGVIFILGDTITDNIRSRMGGGVNIWIFWMMVACLPFLPLFAAKLSNTTIIAIVLGAMPFIERAQSLAPIRVANEFTGAAVNLSGLGIICLVLLVYFCLNGYNQSKLNISSRRGMIALLVITLSCLISQYARFSPMQAVWITYYYMGVHCVWFYLIVKNVHKEGDILRVMVGLAVGVMIASFLTWFTTDKVMLSSMVDSSSQVYGESGGRLDSLIFGNSNNYGGVLSSTLCLLAALMYVSPNILRIAYLIPFLVLSRDLLMNGSRGGWLGAMLIPLYLFILAPQKRFRKISVAIVVFLIGLIAVQGKSIMFFLEKRLVDVNSTDSAVERFSRSGDAINSLMNFPEFLIGYGARTDVTWNSAAHGVHNGFIWMWVTTGIIGFLVFIWWILSELYTGWCVSCKMRKLGKESPILLGLILSSLCWLIYFLTTGGAYAGCDNQVSYFYVTFNFALLAAATDLNQHSNYVSQTFLDSSLPR